MSDLAFLECEELMLPDFPELPVPPLSIVSWLQ
jgi:hypothetical protein